MFFSKFPDIPYLGQKMKDLSIALVIRPEIKNHKDLFFYYEPEEWETPETVAFDFYGQTGYNYIVMLMNDIVDPYFDWFMPRDILTEYCISKYGLPTVVDGVYISDGYFAVNHWIHNGVQYAKPYDPTGLIRGSAPFEAAAVSHFQYEEQRNDAKRRIKILHPALLQNLEQEVDILING